MKTKTLLVAGLAMSIWLVPQNARSATVPAGTILIVRTLHALTSTDAVGTRFPVQLANNVAANGKTVLPPGTKFSGKVVTSRRTVSSTQRLTVDLTDVQVGGHNVPIKTTGAYLVDNQNFKTARGTSVGRGDYSVPVGRHLEFRLAQPLQL
ncbi:MAG: hypothetical protein WAO00_08380 [Chthoniobacterales bacterium]